MCSCTVMNPTGGTVAGRGIGWPDPNDCLLERILSTENVALAWKRVRANKGAPGIDGVSTDDFPDQTRPLW